MGWGDDGRLGHGGDEQAEVPTAVSFFGLRESMRVSRCAAGGRHTLWVVASGDVYTCGANRYGQLGLGDRIGRKIPTRIPTLNGKYVRGLEAGQAASFAMTGDGTVFSWGQGSFGRLGHGTATLEDGKEVELCDMNDELVPRLMARFRGQTVKEVSAGEWHGMAMTMSGRVFIWGRNNFGQLGQNDTNDRSYPCEMKFGSNDKPLQVSCGRGHSLTMVETKRPDNRLEKALMVWGDNSANQLGGVDDRRRMIPQEVQNLSASLRKARQWMTAIAAGGYHNLVLTSSGQVISFGKGDFGALGYGDVWDRPDTVWVPNLSEVTQIRAGGRHSLCLKGTTGEVFSWGFNNFGELGQGDTDVRLQPSLVSAIARSKVLHVECGERVSLIITDGLARKVRDEEEYTEYFQRFHQEGIMAYEVIKEEMDLNGLNPDYLDTPDMILGGQPGMPDTDLKPDPIEPGMHYCLDTNPEVDQSERGVYETCYICNMCGMNQICLACARRCHANHCVTVRFRRRYPGELCDCGTKKTCTCVWSVVRDEFNKVDKDASGFIDVQELRELIEALRKQTITEDELELAVNELDQNDDHQISFEEFRDWYDENLVEPSENTEDFYEV